MTVRDIGWGVTVDTRLTAVKEVVEYGKHTLEVTFDKDKPTFMSKMKREMAQIQPELKR